MILMDDVELELELHLNHHPRHLLIIGNDSKNTRNLGLHVWLSFWSSGTMYGLN